MASKNYDELSQRLNQEEFENHGDILTYSGDNYQLRLKSQMGGMSNEVRYIARMLDFELSYSIGLRRRLEAEESLQEKGLLEDGEVQIEEDSLLYDVIKTLADDSEELYSLLE